MSQFELEATTTWVNTNDETARFSLLRDNGKFYRVEIKPGMSMKIPSVYDSAIRKEKNGVVIAGACPWLKKANETNIQVHQTLDYKQVVMENKLTALAEEIRKDHALEEAKEVLKKKNGK